MVGAGLWSDSQPMPCIPLLSLREVESGLQPEADLLQKRLQGDVSPRHADQPRNRQQQGVDGGTSMPKELSCPWQTNPQTPGRARRPYTSHPSTERRRRTTLPCCSAGVEQQRHQFLHRRHHGRLHARRSTWRNSRQEGQLDMVHPSRSCGRCTGGMPDGWWLKGKLDLPSQAAITTPEKSGQDPRQNLPGMETMLTIRTLHSVGAKASINNQNHRNHLLFPRVT